MPYYITVRYYSNIPCGRLDPTASHTNIRWLLIIDYDIKMASPCRLTHELIYLLIYLLRMSDDFY